LVANAPPPRGPLARATDLVRSHPKTALLIGAELCLLAGAELAAAALLGGAVALLARSTRRRRPRVVS
jgi:hypothetical protein